MSDKSVRRSLSAIQVEVASPVRIEEAAKLRLFVEGYLTDYGVSLQIIEAIIRELFSKPSADAKLPGEMYNQAMEDLVGHTAFGGFRDYDHERVIAAAASLEFVVRYARLVDRKVIPSNVLPEQTTIDKLLRIFNERKAAN